MLCRRIGWRTEGDPMADSKMEDTFSVILSCQGQLKWAQCLIDSMSWPSVKWGEIKHSEDVVNQDTIFIFRDLGAHVNHSVLGKWEPATCGGQFTFLCGWWCDIHMIGKAWLQSGYILYLSILLDTVFSSICTGRGNGGRRYDPNSHGSMACDICISGVGNQIWEGSHIASMPCSIRSPQGLRALRRGPALASRPNLSQRSIPWDQCGHSTWV
jgi:hypothetical protein